MTNPRHNVNMVQERMRRKAVQAKMAESRQKIHAAMRKSRSLRPFLEEELKAQGKPVNPEE